LAIKETSEGEREKESRSSKKDANRPSKEGLGGLLMREESREAVDPERGKKKSRR